MEHLQNTSRLLPHDVHASQLRKLTLINIVTKNANILTQILCLTADKLEELTLVGVPSNVLATFRQDRTFYNGSFHAPKHEVIKIPALKVLRIERGTDEPPRFDHMRMVSFRSSVVPLLKQTFSVLTFVSPKQQIGLVAIAPNLEQLCLDGFQLYHQVKSNDDLDITPWSRLRVLVLGPGITINPCSQLGGNWFSRLLNPEMRVVDIMFDSAAEARSALFKTTFPQITDSGVNFSPLVLPKLEVFRCRGQVDPISLEQIIGPAIVDGNLHSLDVCLGRYKNALSPLNLDFQRPPAEDLRLPATELSFTFSEHITTLGLRDFEWSNTADYYSAFNPKPFLEWLDRFPNVHTVRAYPGPIADSLILFMELLKRSDRVKVIYQDSLDLKEYYVAKAEADKRGVILHHKYKEMAPARFPYPVTWE